MPSPAVASTSSRAFTCQRVARVNASIAIIVGALALVGWWLGIPAFTSLFMGLAPMKPNSAVRKLTAELGFMGAKPINRLVNAGMPSHQPTSARAPTMMAIEALTRATRWQVKARDDVEATAGEGISLPLQLLPYHYN